MFTNTHHTHRPILCFEEERESIPYDTNPATHVIMVTMGMDGPSCEPRAETSYAHSHTQTPPPSGCHIKHRTMNISILYS